MPGVAELPAKPSLEGLEARWDARWEAEGTFATVVCGALDATAGTLTVARAGHPDLLVVDRDGARFLDAPLGPPVGVDPSWTYSSKSPSRSVTRERSRAKVSSDGSRASAIESRSYAPSRSPFSIRIRPSRA